MKKKVKVVVLSYISSLIGFLPSTQKESMNLHHSLFTFLRCAHLVKLSFDSEVKQDVPVEVKKIKKPQVHSVIRTWRFADIAC